MWPFDEPALQRQARFAGSGVGRLLYRYLNFSLRVLMPLAYAQRRLLTPALHAQYLAPFRERASRVQVLWALARALLGSAAHYGKLWSERARLASIPALVLWGSGDRLFPASFAERWRAALPRAEVQQLPGVGHWPHEEAPDTVLTALRSFLDRAPNDANHAA
jgi:haloalkane dehalogenase